MCVNDGAQWKITDPCGSVSQRGKLQLVRWWIWAQWWCRLFLPDASHLKPLSVSPRRAGFKCFPSHSHSVKVYRSVKRVCFQFYFFRPSRLCCCSSCCYRWSELMWFIMDVTNSKLLQNYSAWREYRDLCCVKLHILWMQKWHLNIWCVLFQFSNNILNILCIGIIHM